MFGHPGKEGWCTAGTLPVSRSGRQPGNTLLWHTTWLWNYCRNSYAYKAISVPLNKYWLTVSTWKNSEVARRGVKLWLASYLGQEPYNRDGDRKRAPAHARICCEDFLDVARGKRRPKFPKFVCFCFLFFVCSSIFVVSSILSEVIQCRISVFPSLYHWPSCVPLVI